MSLICTCPASVAINTIENVECPVSFGQIQKVIFQRIYNPNHTGFFDENRNSKYGGYNWEAVGNYFGNAPAGVIQAKFAATDAIKMVITPYINAPEDSGGDVRQTAGGNDDLSGVAEVLGGESVQFAGVLRSCPQSLIAALKELQCDALNGNLGVYLIDENGQVECLGIPGRTSPGSDLTTIVLPIPIRDLFIGDKIHGNYDGKDHNVISWNYLPNYSDNLIVVPKPKYYNPLTDLTNYEPEPEEEDSNPAVPLAPGTEVEDDN